MGRRVDVDQLIDAHEVARILGLSRSTGVATYAGRYDDMPAPVVDLGPGRPKLWHRREVERWQAKRRRGRNASGA
jgi:glutathione-regulated potassium-efflux system ancillary protein KefG